MTQDSMFQISEVMSDIPEAQSILINQIVYELKRKGHNPTVLSLGEAYFDIPKFEFGKTDFENGYHYSDSLGIPSLRQKIANYYKSQYLADVDAEREMIITVGSKAVIYMAMRVILNAGDEVLIHEPYWLSYPAQAAICGAVSKFIPHYVPVGEFESYFTAKTRILIINNPNNPSGKVYSREELRTLRNLCRSRGVYFLCDEAYSDFTLEKPFVSAATDAGDLDGLLVVNSLSKNQGISGWRIGYLIAHRKFISHMLVLNQHLITCASTVLLQYCDRNFERLLEITLPQARKMVEKRSRIAKMMDDLKIGYLPGSATFYFLVSIGDFPGTSEEFAVRLLFQKHIAVVPGTAYGDSTSRYVRLSVGAESEERIWEALQVFKAVTLVGSLDPLDILAVSERLGLRSSVAGLIGGQQKRLK
ncbi:MAG: hypothetical protein HW380_870 [Magnetococcales bacterium]|nr:hypothetical protein [Magnetococcales bacterium]